METTRWDTYRTYGGWYHWGNKILLRCMGQQRNLCSRLETASKPGCINVSEEFMEFTKDFFEFEPRGFIEIKNREPVNMYFLMDIKKELRSGHFQPNELFYEKYEQYSSPPNLEI